MTFTPEILLAGSAIAILANVAVIFTFGLTLWGLRRQLRAAEETTRSDHDRRKKQATIEFWAQTLDRRAALGRQLPYDRDREAVEKMLAKAGQSDSEQVRTITDVLGFYEMLATAINTDVFDIGVFSRIAGSRIISVANNYGPWIQERRKLRNQPKLYEELLLLAERLKVHRQEA